MAREASVSIYPYEPVKALPIIFTVIISFIASLHFYQTFIRYKWPRFGFTMMLASGVWISGFICRSISVYQPRNVDIYIAQYILVFIGPPLYAAAETFILGRLFAYLPYHAPIHPGRVLSTFLLLSVVVEALSSTGASYSAGSVNHPELREEGLTLVKAGLILQCAIEVAFFALVALLHHRCRRTGTLARNVLTMCCVLYVTSAMMLVRCIVRVVEGFQAAACDPRDPGYTGFCGPVETQEWFLWVFEVANITIFIFLLAVFTPGKYLPRDDKQYLDPVDRKTERLGPGFSQADSRPLIVTILDPFNIGGILTGRGMVVDKFWERDHPLSEVNYAGRGGAVSKDAAKMSEGEV